MRAALAAGLTALALVEASTILPYNPTTVFLSPNDSSIAYIIQPPSIGDVGSGRTGGLLKLNISQGINASDISSLNINTGLPLYTGGTEGGSNDTYAPWIAPDGTIGLYAGNCDPNGSSDPDTHSSLWIHEASASSEDAGSWTQATDSISPSQALLASGISYEASYLSSTFWFSTTISDSFASGSIYTFGGMCPWQGESGQNKANYTNNMLKLSPNSSAEKYEISLAGATSLKPVTEAGFTMTGLTPVVSNSSKGVATQAQNVVLIGGHTQGAFIGMTQVAVFSLPQEVWTYQSVDAASQDSGSELAVRRRDGTWKSVPDSRSGHTAVLSSDGSKIIIFGGWVGDIETPADPQLAVLYLGSGFGGDGDWRWEHPTPNGTGLGDGEGIFGHGAAMLPGDVLMVVGGYRISVSSGNSKRESESSGLQALFLNTTSMSFMDSYTNPSYIQPQADDPSAPGYTPGASGGANDNAKKVGLGAGLGIGLAAILGAVAVYFWYRRKLNRRDSSTREKDLAQLSQTAHWDETNSGEMHQRIGSGSLAYVQEGYGPGAGNGHGDLGYAAEGAAYGPLEYQGYDHGHIDDSSISYVQPQGFQHHNSFTNPRKPPNARNARGFYQPTPPAAANNAYSSFDFGAGTHSRANSLGTAGAIHPIYEQDEDDNGEIVDSHLIGVARGDASEGNPFDDPSPGQRSSMSKLQLQPNAAIEPPPRSPLREQNPRLKLTPSEEKLEKQRELQEWVSDWAAADAYTMGRTASTLQQDGVNRQPSTSQQYAAGRLSPGKTDTNSHSGRTDSNLSDQSAVTLSRNDSTSTRTKSLTAFFQGTSGWGLFGGAANAPQHGTAARRPTIITSAYLGPASGRVTAESFYPSGSISPGESERSNTLTATGAGAAQAQSLMPPRSAGSNSNHSSGNGSHSGNSYMTAHSHISAGFTGLKEQAETLLPRYGDWIGGTEPGSPSKSKGRARKGSMGWLGSIKKVLGREEWVGSPGTEEGEKELVEKYRQYDVAAYADSPSPTRITFGGEDLYSGEGMGMPTRTASAGANLWRRKQGRSDWEDSADDGGYGALGGGVGGVGGVQRSFTTATPGAVGRDERAEEEEWDVEKAVRGRQVQVMFTVPKERLRVVNHDVSDDESDIGVVRGSSNRSAASAMSARSGRGGRRSPIRDLLTGSPQRSPTRESMRVDLEMGDMGVGDSPATSRKGKEVLRDVPTLQPIRHLPPPRDESPSPDPELRPRPLGIVRGKRAEEARPRSPVRELLMRDSEAETGVGERPISPSRSMRSIKSGRVQDLVKQMEKK